jgi:hypothetical protein
MVVRDMCEGPDKVGEIDGLKLEYTRVRCSAPSVVHGQGSFH